MSLLIFYLSGCFCYSEVYEGSCLFMLQPSMLVVPDIQDVYTPRQTDLLVPLTEVNISLSSLFQL